MAGIYEKIKCKQNRNNEFIPTQSQADVLNYFVYQSTYKGLLLYHKLGAGKTCTSVLIADRMIREGKIDKVYILTPGSLRTNWIDEYCKKCGEKFISSHFVFMTYNSNLKSELDYYQFDRSLIIIDEAHNIFNGVKNLSNNPLSIYKKIYESNCRVLLLTGTPIIQYISEWALMGNILNPDGFKNILKYDGSFPYVIEEVFNHTRITDKQLQGIVSYYPGDKDLYPTTIYHNPIKCKMNKAQYNKYRDDSEQEQMIINVGPPAINDPQYAKKNQLYVMAIKRIPSRRVSNALYCHHVLVSYNYYIRTLKYLKLLDDKYVDEKNRIEDNESEEYELKMKIYNTQIEMVQNYIIMHTCEKETIRLGFYDIIYKIMNGSEVQNLPNEIKELVEQFKIANNNIELLETQQKLNLRILSSQFNVTLVFNDIANFDDLIVLKQLQNLLKPNVEPLRGADIVESILEYNYTTKWIEDGLINKYPNLLFEISPKYTALLINIISRIRTKHVIFSFFKGGIGIETISKLLSKCGITYGVFSGDINDIQRRKVLEVFNSVENRDGKLMNILFITEAGAEGISLLEVNNMHILESGTREHKITQAIGRVARIYSHIKMPKDRQYVNVWRYWSTAYIDPTEENEVTICIDEKLYNQGQTVDEGKNVFLSKLIKNSIENVPPNIDDMPNVTNYAKKLSVISHGFYDIIDKDITEVRFDKPNVYALLAFTTSTVKIPSETKHFITRFPNILDNSGYNRVESEHKIWATLDSRNEAGTYIIVSKDNVNVIMAFIQQTIRIPANNIIDPLEPYKKPEKYKDRINNMETILLKLSQTLPIGSTVAIQSSIGTNREVKYMSAMHEIISDIGKTNTSIRFNLYSR
jgi:superfamily II DNA or RNA helicase